MQEPFQQKAEIAVLFGDLHPPFEAQAAVVESNRCLNCFDAPCTAACPTHIGMFRSSSKRSPAGTYADRQLAFLMLMFLPPVVRGYVRFRCCAKVHA